MKYIKYHNEDGTLNELANKFLEDSDCASFPKYRKKKSLMPLITDQIRPVWYKGSKCIKLPLSNLTRTSKIFNKVFEDELIDTFIKESELKECFNIYFKIPKELYDSRIRQFRVIPNKYGTDYYVDFIYEVESFLKAKSNIQKSMAIDLGISNLATCVTTDNESFIIDGKHLKSINQFYNKQKATYQSLLPKNKRYSKRLAKLDGRRNRQVEDYLNKSVITIISKIKELNVDEVIIGWNKSIKTGGVKNTKLKGKNKKKVNQTFVSIPLSRFKDKLIFKCKQHGIKVTTISESYTSKVSFYDNDKIEKGNYSGERIKRGLYKRYNSNVLINADVNGALNIYKKYILKCNSTNNKINYLMSRGLTIPSRVLVKL
jgi:IS605 OrfB family transposase